MECGVSLITIVIRQQFFRKRFRHMVMTDPRARERARDIELAEEKEHRFQNIRHPFAFGSEKKDATIPSSAQPNLQRSAMPAASPETSGSRNTIRTRSMTKRPFRKRKRDKIRIDMIRRIDGPVKINQMNVGGFLAEEEEEVSTPSDDLRPTGSFPVSKRGRQNVDDDGNDDQLGSAAPRTESPGNVSISEPLESLRDNAPVDPKARRVSIFEEHPPRSEQIYPSPTLNVAEDQDGLSNEVSSDEREDRVTFQSRRSSDPISAISRPPPSDKAMKRIRTLDPPKASGNSLSGLLARTHTIEIREPEMPRHSHTTALPRVGTMYGDTMRRRTGIPLERSVLYVLQNVAVEVSLKISID